MFRFTIRDVLWLTVVVGLALGWCFNRSQLINDLEGMGLVVADLREFMHAKHPGTKIEITVNGRLLQDKRELEDADKN